MPRFVRRGPTVPFRSARRRVSLEGPRGIGGTEPPVPPRRSSGPACLRAFSVWLHLRNRADFPARPSVPSAMRAARPPSPQNATKSSEASLTTPAPTAEVGSTFHAAQNLHPPPFTLSRLPASTLRAARMFRSESSASIFASSGVMPRPATPAGTEGSGKTRPRLRSFSSTVTGCFRKKIRRRRVEKRIPLLSPSYGGPVARKTRAAATFAMPKAVTNPIVA